MTTIHEQPIFSTRPHLLGASAHTIQLALHRGGDHHSLHLSAIIVSTALSCNCNAYTTFIQKPGAFIPRNSQLPSVEMMTADSSQLSSSPLPSAASCMGSAILHSLSIWYIYCHSLCCPAFTVQATSLHFSRHCAPFLSAVDCF